MLTQLNIETFKCFNLLKLPLSPLTLLSGANASGKSSVLQSLVLLHQTMREYEWSTRLMLNGTITKLGTVTDVVDQINGRNSFNIELVDYHTFCQWSFTGDRRDMSLAVSYVEFENNTFDNPTTLRYLVPSDADDAVKLLASRIRDLTYITAGREGPREIYPLEDQHTVSVVGPEGENAISVLYRGRDGNTMPELTLPEAVPTLFHQVEARLNMFFKGCALNLQQIPNANAVAMGIRISPDTGFLRPVHCGFGITQILPIIVAALSASKNNILLIENPEVHLHPAGQALIGQFLADVAHAGVQVIVETHSDHVLNGIRRSVKAGKILPEEVTIHFFKPRMADLPQVLSPLLDISGNIDAWPDGFFDQFDKDMDFFAGWGE